MKYNVAWSIMKYYVAWSIMPMPWWQTFNFLLETRPGACGFVLPSSPVPNLLFLFSLQGFPFPLPWMLMLCVCSIGSLGSFKKYYSKVLSRTWHDPIHIWGRSVLLDADLLSWTLTQKEVLRGNLLVTVWFTSISSESFSLDFLPRLTWPLLSMHIWINVWH